MLLLLDSSILGQHPILTFPKSKDGNFARNEWPLTAVAREKKHVRLDQGATEDTRDMVSWVRKFYQGDLESMGLEDEIKKFVKTSTVTPPFKISKISRYQEKKARNASKTPRQKFEVDRENGGWKERGRGWGKLPKCRKKTLGTSFTCTSLEKITFFSPKNEGLVQDDFSFSKFVDFWGSSRSFSVTKLRRLRNHLCRSKEK